MIHSMLLLIHGPTYPVPGKPLSVTSRHKYKSKAGRDALRVPLSALEILQVNRQVHDEAHKLFYQNDLVFSSPTEMHDFMCSLSDQRFDCLRSLTFFCDEISVTTSKSGVIETGLGVTLLLLRRFNGLQKLHLLLQFRLIWETANPWVKDFVDSVDVSRLQDAKTLFTLRGVADIMVQDLDLIKFRERCDEMVESQPAQNRPRYRQEQKQTIRQMAALRHFNHGLQLAQTGVVVRELYIDENWRENETWPALQGSDCGLNKGCSCGGGDDEPDEVVEINDDDD